MYKMLYSRRTFLGFTGLMCLLILGLRGEEVGIHIVSIVLGIMGANAAEGIMVPRQGDTKGPAQ